MASGDDDGPAAAAQPFFDPLEYFEDPWGVKPVEDEVDKSGRVREPTHPADIIVLVEQCLDLAASLRSHTASPVEHLRHSWYRYARLDGDLCGGNASSRLASHLYLPVLLAIEVTVADLERFRRHPRVQCRERLVPYH